MHYEFVIQEEKMKVLQFVIGGVLIIIGLLASYSLFISGIDWWNIWIVMPISGIVLLLSHGSRWDAWIARAIAVAVLFTGIYLMMRAVRR
jgi:hypothetical protein